MDPLSIAANVIGVTAFCAKIAQGVGRFVIDVREVPETLAGFYGTIHNLQTALQGVERAFRQHPEQLPFEKDHHQNISHIIQSCQSALVRLENQLPDLHDTASPYERLRTSLIVSVKKNAVQQNAANIESYTQVLQLSLATLSLGSQWKTQRSQEQIHDAIRHLTDSIRSASLLSAADEEAVVSGVVVGGVPPLSAADATSSTAIGTLDDAASTMTVTQEIQAWKNSVTEMAEVMSLYEPSQVKSILVSDATSGRHVSSDSGISVVDGDDESELDDDAGFDPEPDHPDHPSREILQFHYDQNQKIVSQLVRCGIFVRASAYQRKAIDYRTQLFDAYNVPFSYDDRADMKEFLAEILIGSETREGSIEARGHLQTLLADEVHRSQDQINQDRRCRLYHKLGKLYLGQGNTERARVFLGRAFEGRRKMNPVPQDLVAESVDLLIEALQVDQSFDEARGYLEWKRKHVPAKQLSQQPVQQPAQQPSTPPILAAPPSRFVRIPAEPFSDSSTGSHAGLQTHSPYQPADLYSSAPRPESITALPIHPSAAFMATANAATTLPEVAGEMSPPAPFLSLATASTSEPIAATVSAPISVPALSPMPVPLPSPIAAPNAAAGLSNAFAWCMNKGFDINDPSFRFEVFDSDQKTSPLHLALLEENLTVFRQMADHVLDFEHRDATLATPLLVAAGTRNRETTRILLERGAKVDVRDINSLTPLHRCQSRSGGVQVAKLLLQFLPQLPTSSAAQHSRPHMINTTDASGRTALYIAMDKGNEKMARFLLAEGANPDTAEVLGKTPLYMSCERGDAIMARCVLEYGAYVDAQGPGSCTPLIAAIESTVPAMVKCALIKMLLDHGADPHIPDADGRTAFIAARKTSFSSEIKWLLQQQQQQRARMMSTDTTHSVATVASANTDASGSPASRTGSFTSRGSRRR